MKSIKSIRFFAEFTDSDGIRHHAIHVYYPTAGIVDMMRDFKFQGMSYPVSDAETYRYGREYELLPRYKIQCNSGKAEIKVLDTREDRCIATFFDMKLAEEYCEQMNLDDTYVDKLEDDPWL